MKLELSGDYTCVHASLAMVCRLPTWEVAKGLPLYFPFPPPYEGVPAGHSMVEVCRWLWADQGMMAMPFDRDPTVAICPGTPSVPVWGDGEKMWRQHLGYGEGLLEGRTERLSGGEQLYTGHMCAWDGKQILDPRGYKYELSAADDMGFYPERFWLVV